MRINREEFLNAITHSLGVLFSLISCLLLLEKYPNSDWMYKFGVIIFSSGAFLLYLSSTLYHSVRSLSIKRILRKLDHICIYVLIAASYTPVWLLIIGGVVGWIGFGVMWLIAFIGSIYKMLAIGKFPKLSLILYLAMGWSVLFVVKPVWNTTPFVGLIWLFVEGISYSFGTYFYANDSKYKYFHAIWHVFVLLGSVAHLIFLIETL